MTGEPKAEPHTPQAAGYSDLNSAEVGSARASTLAERIAWADGWIDLARRQIDEGVWTPQPTERARAADLMKTIDRPIGPTQTGFPQRGLAYLARWTPLASASYGLGSGMARTERRPASVTTVTFADILAAVRPLIATSAQWQWETDDNHGQQLRPDAEALLDEVEATLVSLTDVLVRIATPTSQWPHSPSPAA